MSSPGSLNVVSRGPAARVVIQVGLATALATAAVHLCQIAFIRFGLGEFTWFSRDVAWMAPVGYVVLFLPFMLAAALVAAAVPAAWRRLLVAVAVGGFATLGTFSLLLPYTRIARYASALLALGVGVQAARLAWRDVVPFGRRAARTAVALGAALLVVIVAVGAVSRLSERRAFANLPAAANDAPNVLLIILDTVRAASLSAYGYARETSPGLAALASRGALFEQAYSVAPWTLPSHASMFTGHYGGELNADWREPLDDTRPTLAETFARHGYATVGVAANQRYAGWESGLSRGFAHFDDFMRTWRQVLYSTWLGQTTSVVQSADAGSLGGAAAALARANLWVDANRAMDERDAREVTDGFLDWERGQRDGRPFFAFLNYFDAHEKVDPPAPYATMFAPGGGLPDLYDGAVRFIDDEVARLVAELERRGSGPGARRTIVVVTADHGELLGDHGLTGHAHNLYARVLHVPLIVAGGGVPAGTRVTMPVSLRDLAATLLDVAGVPNEAAIPGASLAAAWRGTPLAPSPLLSELPSAINPEPGWPIAKGPMASLVDQGRHYIRLGDGTEELYDVTTGDAEAVDLRADTAEAARLDTLRAGLGRLAARLRARPQPNEREPNE